MASRYTQRVSCSACGTSFVRAYRLGRDRAARPQYCSGKCYEDGQKAKADKRRYDRFWSKVEERAEAECWPWLGFKDSNGYGKFQWAHGKPMLAHRVAYLFGWGVEPASKVVCHACDNPSCCNPYHLWLGSQADNVADMIAKGRRKRVTPRRGEACNKAKITAADALAIFGSEETQTSLARRYGITATAVRHIKRGQNWAHVTGARDNA
jgi:hypothetical protein